MLKRQRLQAKRSRRFEFLMAKVKQAKGLEPRGPAKSQDFVGERSRSGTGDVFPILVLQYRGNEQVQLAATQSLMAHSPPMKKGTRT